MLSLRSRAVHSCLHATAAPKACGGCSRRCLVWPDAVVVAARQVFQGCSDGGETSSDCGSGGNCIRKIIVLSLAC